MAAAERRPLPPEENPDRQKISAALLELIEPYMDAQPSPDELRTMVGIGALAWNTSLLSRPKRFFKIRELARKTADPKLFEATFREMIARKLELFPDDKRLVVSWEVSRMGRDRYNVTAAALGGF